MYTDIDRTRLACFKMDRQFHENLICGQAKLRSRISNCDFWWKWPNILLTSHLQENPHVKTKYIKMKILLNKDV